MSPPKTVQPAEPTFEIQNLDRGATIEITATGDLDKGAWTELKAALVRLIGIREPMRVRLDLRAVSERSAPSGSWRQAEQAAMAVGAVLSVIGPADRAEGQRSGQHADDCNDTADV